MELGELKPAVKKETRKINVKKIKEKIEEDRKNIDTKILQDFKTINPYLEKINLKIVLSLENAAINALSVGIISGIIANTIGILHNKENKIKTENYYWKIIPMYENKNYLNVTLDCIISIKLIHIIYTIYKNLLRKKGGKNGRTSNRRAYDYSDE